MQNRTLSPTLGQANSLQDAGKETKQPQLVQLVNQSNSYYSTQKVRPAEKAHLLSLSYKMGALVFDALAINNFESVVEITKSWNPTNKENLAVFEQMLKMGKVTVSQIKISTNNPQSLFNKDIVFTTLRTDGTKSTQTVKMSSQASEFAYQSGILTLPVDIIWDALTVMSINSSDLLENDVVNIDMELKSVPMSI